MIVVLFAIAAFAVPSPAATTTPRPLREVVYSVTTNWSDNSISESYAGGADAVLPNYASFEQGQGTVTIDVLGRDSNGALFVYISEYWKTFSRQLPFTGAVMPEGVLDFPSTGPAALDDICGELLPYFGTRFAPQGTLDTTTHWSMSGSSGKISSHTEYQVTAVAGDTVTLHKVQNIKGIGSVSVDGSVVYEPSMLMPLSGTIRKSSTEMLADGQDTTKLQIDFRLVSDTFPHRS